MSAENVPPGFEAIAPFGKFHELVGPLYGLRTPERDIVGMRVAEKHGNRGSNLHGGMLCTLADSAMTWSCSLRRKPDTAAVTTNLSIEMMGSAKPGDWIEAQVDVMRMGGRVVFLNAFVVKGDERIARASATFQIVPRPGNAPAPAPVSKG